VALSIAAQTFTFLDPLVSINSQISSDFSQGGNMRREISIMIAVAVVVSLVLVTGLYAQMKKDTKSGLDRIEGTVMSIEKKESTITIRVGTTGVIYKAVYNDQTTFTYRNAKSSLDAVKDGQRVVCLGKAESANRLAAYRVDIRSK
jgi:hypothetical protein